MWLISLDWYDKVAVLGWLGMASATTTLLGWWGINRLFNLKLP